LTDRGEAATDAPAMLVGGSDAQRQLFDRITEFADAASR